MKAEERALAQYRIEQAEDALVEADALQKIGKYRGAINRAYYSMFYAASALLATKGFGSSKHSGVISLLHKEFVRPGLFPSEVGKFIDSTFALRGKSDYAAFAKAVPEEATSVIQMAEQFVQETRRVLERL